MQPLDEQRRAISQIERYVKSIRDPGPSRKVTSSAQQLVTKLKGSDEGRRISIDDFSVWMVRNGTPKDAECLCDLGKPIFVIFETDAERTHFYNYLAYVEPTEQRFNFLRAVHVRRQQSSGYQLPAFRIICDLVKECLFGAAPNENYALQWIELLLKMGGDVGQSREYCALLALIGPTNFNGVSKLLRNLYKAGTVWDYSYLEGLDILGAMYFLRGDEVLAWHVWRDALTKWKTICRPQFRLAAHPMYPKWRSVLGFDHLPPDESRPRLLICLSLNLLSRSVQAMFQEGSVPLESWYEIYNRLISLAGDMAIRQLSSARHRVDVLLHMLKLERWMWQAGSSVIAFAKYALDVKTPIDQDLTIDHLVKLWGSLVNFKPVYRPGKECDDTVVTENLTDPIIAMICRRIDVTKLRSEKLPLETIKKLLASAKNVLIRSGFVAGDDRQMRLIQERISQGLVNDEKLLNQYQLLLVKEALSQMIELHSKSQRSDVRG